MCSLVAEEIGEWLWGVSGVICDLVAFHEFQWWLQPIKELTSFVYQFRLPVSSRLPDMIWYILTANEPDVHISLCSIYSIYIAAATLRRKDHSVHGNGNGSPYIPYSIYSSAGCNTCIPALTSLRQIGIRLVNMYYIRSTVYIWLHPLLTSAWHLMQSWRA